jgi:hypothetical protein
VTAQVHDPRIDPLPPAIPSTCEPRVARDIRTWSLVARGLRAADRARPLARPPGLADVARAPASDHAADDTPHRTRTGSRSPRPPPRTSDGTRYIYRACPDHVRPRVSPDRVDHDPAAATARITRQGGSRSRREVDLYKAAAEGQAPTMVKLVAVSPGERFAAPQRGSHARRVERERGPSGVRGCREAA